MKLRWFALTLLSVLLWATPAFAGQLLRWRFTEADRQLTFSTTSGVRPQAQLIQNPTRLVIDLPGTRLGRPTVDQRVGSLVRQLRIGQFNSSTTRLVLELAPGYTIDPEQVQFRGVTDQQWTVVLPQPQRLSDLDPLLAVPNFQVTQNGFFIRTDASRLRNVDVDRSRDRREIEIEFDGVDIPSNLRNETLAVDRYGVEQIEFDRQEIQLTVTPDSPDWDLSGGGLGLSIVPRSGQSLPPDRATVQPDVVSIPVPPPERIGAPPPTSSPNPTPPPTFEVPNARILTVIDPGHGGKDPGAIGIGGLREKDVVLPISLEVSRLLSEQGISVLMTRSDDRFISLQGRAVMANRAQADLFVSIHANAISLSRPDVNGVETFYYTTGQRLAQTVQNEILSQIQIGNRGVKRARFYVLRNTSMPSILVEVGFVTGAQDAPRLADPAFRDQMARAIADGILRYISDNY